AQEVFIKVFESISSFKEESKLSTWIYRITVSKSLDHIRKKKRKKRFAFVQSLYGKNEELMIDPPDFFHPGIKIENKENAEVLFKAIDKLTENQKTAFVLNKMENLSYREISEVMNSTEPAVDALLQRAKKNLKTILEKFYSSEDFNG
ncbi:MAG: RNA polymerase sigma factor, partial [Ginsengibacter sp.]